MGGMKKNAKLLMAVGAGLLVGGILGVLFAPDKGTETRRKIADQGKKLADKVKNRFHKEKEDLLSRVNGKVEAEI